MDRTDRTALTFFSQKYRKLSYREGDLRFNFHLSWGDFWGFYICVYGYRAYYFFKRPF